MSGFDLRVVERSRGQGIIKLGDFQEAIRVYLDAAPLAWYEAQWKHSLARLVAQRIDAIVVVSVPARAQAFPTGEEVGIKPPSDEWVPVQGFGQAWTFAVRGDDRVRVHNVLLFPELTIIDGFEVVRLTPTEDDASVMNEPARAPSEWIIDLADVALYLDRLGEPGVDQGP